MRVSIREASLISGSAKSINTNSAEGTDYHAVELGYVSVTPLRSDMTDHQALTAIETWNYLKDSELLHKS